MAVWAATVSRWREAWGREIGCIRIFILTAVEGVRATIDWSLILCSITVELLLLHWSHFVIKVSWTDPNYFGCKLGKIMRLLVITDIFIVSAGCGKLPDGFET